MVKISVIIPVYNAEKYLKRCIDSLLCQSIKEDYELICINDGSIDKSLSLLNEYKDNKKIKIFTQKNQGPAITRNKGIKLASGKYIMFVDSDDFVDSNYLEAYYNAIVDSKNDIVVGGYKRVIGNKIAFIRKLEPVGEFSKYLVVAPYCRIIKKKFIVDNKIEFLDTNLSEDVYFNVLIYNKTKKVGIINDIGYNYYDNKESITNTSHLGLKEDIEVESFLDSINLEKTFNLELNQYFIIRYIINYLLKSGKYATSKKFMCECDKLFDWLKVNIPEYGKNKYLKVFALPEEPLLHRIIVSIFMNLKKLKLMKLFAVVYCRGRE